MVEKNIQNNFLSLLHNKFEESKERNPRVSLRSYAKKIGISAGALSDLFNHKRPVTDKIIKKLLEKLELPPEDVDFIYSKAVGEKHFKHLEPEVFSLISDGIHFSILSLMNLPNFKSDAVWISTKLRKKPMEVKKALTTLKDLGLLAEEQGRFKYTGYSLHSSDGAPSIAVRKSHRQSLEEASSSLDRDSVEIRDFTSLTLSINSSKISEYKEAIRSFRNEITKISETQTPDEVYKISIQFFPLTNEHIN